MKKLIFAMVLLVLSASATMADTVYLRDGRVIRGTVLGYIGGRFAVRIEDTRRTGAPSRNAQAEGEIQFFRPRDIDRVEIEGRSLEEAKYDTRTVEVGLGQNWVDTGVDLRRGERVSVNATGTIIAGRGRITPGGLSSIDPNAPLPRASEGVLIGAIGDNPNAPIIEIGLSRDFQADTDGRLYLTVNRSSYSDARGSFTARIRRERDFSPRRNGNNAGNNNNGEAEDEVFDTTSRPAPVRSRSGDALPGNGRMQSDRPVQRGRNEVTINVPGNSQNLDTGVELRSGDQVTIETTGTIIAGQRAGSVNANGRQGGGASSVFGNPRYPFPQGGVGALVGYVRSRDGQQTPVFLVGTQLVYTAQMDGRLYLSINDDNYSDNSGSFSVRIRVN